MAKSFERLNDAHVAFIRKQHIFFMASAASEGRVNVSPRPTDALRIVDANTVAYRDLTGSGNETAAHIRADGRLTMMFCSFEGTPRILRLFGNGAVARIGTNRYRSLVRSIFDGQEPPGTRQVVVLRFDLVRTSCGYGVPLFSYDGERTALQRWTESKSDVALADYRAEHNGRSIDGFEAGFS